jgi:arsenate reductase
MAEGLLKSLHGDRYEVFSAGTQPAPLHPLAVRVMGEIGIDISAQRSKDVAQFVGREIDVVVTVSDRAKETCPFFPYGRRFLHQGFPDPAAVQGGEQDRLTALRRVRDEIRDWIGREFGETDGWANDPPAQPMMAVGFGRKGLILAARENKKG